MPFITYSCETMPPAVRTLNDLMYWQYAKIIADSAKMGKRQWPFIIDRFKKLQSGGIALDSIREYVKEWRGIEVNGGGSGGDWNMERVETIGAEVLCGIISKV